MKTIFMALILALIILAIANVMASAQQQHYYHLFNIHIQLTNASYIYYNDAEEINIPQTEVIRLVNVYYLGNGINNVWLYIQRPDGQYVGILHVINNGKSYTDSKEILLSPGNYYISILIQPSPVVNYGDNATITIYFIITHS
ncbi:hypothetical protein VMUT_2182 [Vulcanisaeta moutnovskia 768-28]|uniref:Uncharacterized protein n=1 Tax=Vulcanisaeta moutnovskia (strain 768-28) TaxID=985053 RepID=F0QX89_VULM7|nr:hypothetical protein [Vulcanisaeta moutnovskia]ADY02378.1 hypothetical protein VMUT_2182 [Vulcanisaeta moutnovskia 768-28]